MSYSSNFAKLIDVFVNEKASYSLLNDAVPSAINASSMALLNIDSILNENKDYIDEKIDDTVNFANKYISYQEQKIEEIAALVATDELANNKIISDQELTTDLYDKREPVIQDQTNNLIDNKRQLKIVSEELAAVQRKINSYTATANDLQRNADLLNEHSRLSDEVYGEKIKETSLRFEQRNKDLIEQIERAKQYAQYDKTWAGELERLETLAGYYLDDINPYQTKKETEAYSAHDLANLIKQAQAKALSSYDYNYDRESSIKLSKAFYKLNALKTYQLDLTFGTEKITIFGDSSIEDFIAKLQSIGLID